MTSDLTERLVELSPQAAAKRVLQFHADLPLPTIGAGPCNCDFCRVARSALALAEALRRVSVQPIHDCGAHVGWRCSVCLGDDRHSVGFGPEFVLHAGDCALASFGAAAEPA